MRWLATAFLPLGVLMPVSAGAWNFTNIAIPAGLDYLHGYQESFVTEAMLCAGGVAAGDYNRDGFVDLYAVRGDIGPNLLFRNNGNGTFSEVGASAGLNISGTKGCGPVFADYDGDGWLDLFIGGIEGTTPRLYRNNKNGTFTNVTAASGLLTTFDTYSGSWGDYDRDGDIDLFMTHWGPLAGTAHLWRNNGNGTFTDVDSLAGVIHLTSPSGDFTYTGNFVDLNDDNWPDLVVAVDFSRSRVYLNDGDGTFTNVTNSVISDENGMGSAIGDYDGDGDLDWFVSSIWDSTGFPEGNWGISGNRLYRNQGNGTFVDATDAAGVREGFWGWGSTFADLNNDGNLDLYHVNGWDHILFENDPSRLYVSNGNATFTERGVELSAAHVGQGRGVVCFDMERDGDLDIFIANNRQRPALLRNNGGNAGHWLTVKLRGTGKNSEAVGARIFATAGGVTQMRELRAGSNYVSQDPAEAHFGLGSNTVVTTLRIEWPDGPIRILSNVAADQFLLLGQQPTSVAAPPDGAPTLAVLDAHAAFPNPIARDGTFSFTLKSGAPVRLRVFDATGSLVRTLVDEVRPAGDHAVAWDGRAASGGSLAGGVYFYRLDAGAQSVTGKVTLLR